jgi:hypothetical protein
MEAGAWPPGPQYTNPTPAGPPPNVRRNARTRRRPAAHRRVCQLLCLAGRACRVAVWPVPWLMIKLFIHKEGRYID